MNTPRPTSSIRSVWHGPKHYFGLHAKENDTELGLRCSPKELVPMLRLMDADFVQTDCKGHGDYL